MEDEIDSRPNNDIDSIPESFPVVTTDSNTRKIETLSVQNMEKSCGCTKEGCSCHTAELSVQYVYVIGKILPRFPTKSLEMELAQVIGRKKKEETKSVTKAELNYDVLTDVNNRYIVRQLCWVLSVENLETYILLPNDPSQFDQLANAIRPTPGLGDIDVIIGRRGPMAEPKMCKGLILPVVMVDQIYSFDRNALIKAIPKQKVTNEGQFRKTAGELFDYIVQIADNAGATDEHRALNYLAVRYDEIYHRTQSMQNENYSFIGVEVRPSRLTGARRIVDVIFSYENRVNRAVQKWFVRVDVMEEFPFPVSPMQEYFER